MIPFLAARASAMLFARNLNLGTQLLALPRMREEQALEKACLNAGIEFTGRQRDLGQALSFTREYSNFVHGLKTILRELLPDPSDQIFIAGESTDGFCSCQIEFWRKKRSLNPFISPVDVIPFASVVFKNEVLSGGKDSREVGGFEIHMASPSSELSSPEILADKIATRLSQATNKSVTVRR